MRITSRESPYIVPGEAKSLLTIADERVLAGLRLLWGHPRKSVPVYALTRGDNGAFAPAPSKLQPGGRQVVPRNLDAVALVWVGGPATLQVSAGTLAEVDSGRLSWAWVAVPADEPSAEIRLGGQATWRIDRTTDVPPAPPWLAGPKALGPTERIIRAAWLLQEGPPEWRTFAITELARLSTQDPVAMELWTAIRSGELEL